ncbi:hypothetical protein [Actinotalea sp. K2]|uniref:hypothetical protein n=1 Tax=Actinotalea sp. K2 TaxID=2939438 RepID=UPI002017B920|nr:hypothetical protein [Actinotalea sp. K2]MCL3863005.1 hypothetical protein [Actinotalea sp. K2]
MPVQDDAREQQMIDKFNLVVAAGRGRSDVDAVLELEELEEPLPFELKSTTSKSVSTVRDFGPQHIAKWRDMHWLFAFYDKAGSRLLSCRYASPADMAPWIAEKERYVLPDLILAQRAPQLVTDEVLVQVLGDRARYEIAEARSIMKNQWSAAQYVDNADLDSSGYSKARMVELLRERCGYVIRRGATLNNPHIPGPYLDGLPVIEKDHAARLRVLVRAYLAEKRTAEAAGGNVRADVDPVVMDQAKAAATEDATA